MANIFEYKPQLQYVLEDINSINNVRDQDIKIEEQFIRTLPSINLEKVKNNLSKLEKLEKEVSNTLKNISIKSDADLVDDSLNELIFNQTDGDKYIDNKTITYNLYKDCKDNPLLKNIANEWERYHSDVDGVIEAEIYPYIEDLIEDNELIKLVIEDTLIYDKEFLTSEDLRVQELLEIESMIKSKKDLNKAYSKKNIDETRALRKNVELKNIKFNFRTNMYEVLNDLINESSELIDKISDEINSSTKKNLEEVYSLQSNELSKTIPDSNKLKLLLYQGFKDKRDKYFSMKKEKDIAFGSAVKKNTEKALSAYSRMYLDVAMPTVLDMGDKLISNELAPGITHVLSGIEDVVIKKEVMMVDFKNILKASNKKTKESLKLINEKDRSRRLYNNIK